VACYADMTWVRGPWWDGFWLLSGIPLAAALSVLAIWVPPLWLFVGSFMLLQTGHSLSPMVLAWTHRAFRRLMMARPVKYIWLPVGILVGSSLIGYVAGTFWPEPRFDPITAKIAVSSMWNPLWAMAAAYFAWNIYHFGKQNFGVMSIYRAKAGGFPSAQRRIDLIYCCASATAVLALPLAQKLGYRPIPLVHVGIALAAVAFMLWRSERLNLPRVALISSNGLAMATAAWWPLGAVGLVNVNHWLTAIGLAGHVHANYRSQRSYLFSLAVIVIGLVLFCLLFVDLKHFTISTTFAATAIGFRLGLGNVHFLYDRWVWKLSDPRVQATIGLNLLNQREVAACEVYAPLTP
jgi:hypothetical protein